MILFDTHAHLIEEEPYEKDLADVFARAVDAGVHHIMIASSTIDDSKLAIDAVQKYASDKLRLCCMVGVHPSDADSFGEVELQKLRSWLEKKEQYHIRAVGEIGLDYYYGKENKDAQRECFIEQLKLAVEWNMPCVIHERDAMEDMLSILEAFAVQGSFREQPGVIHCYSGSVESSEKLLAMGFYLGFDGPLTFKNARKAPDVVRACPLDRLLIETDSPYLTPTPFRGRRNESQYVTYVAEAMAKLRNLTTEEIAQITTENACRLFEEEMYHV
ncbi:MAG TPA: TatD family hydrolase [Bacillota bacterium]|nr:TatD family hydrolase [Bacillota bacterium]